MHGRASELHYITLLSICIAPYCQSAVIGCSLGMSWAFSSSGRRPDSADSTTQTPSLPVGSRYPSSYPHGATYISRDVFPTSTAAFRCLLLGT